MEKTRELELAMLTVVRGLENLSADTASEVVFTNGAGDLSKTWTKENLENATQLLKWYLLSEKVECK